MAGVGIDGNNRTYRSERTERTEKESKCREEEDKRYRKECKEQKAKRIQLLERLHGEELNKSGGFDYKVCDMERLKRFILLGSEFNTYCCDSKDILIESVQCVERLIASNHYQAVLDTIEKYANRVAKHDPLLTVLAKCATHDRLEVRKAAYEKVNSICNIPTKLFKFIDQTHEEIVRQRIANPPEPQLYRKQRPCSAHVVSRDIPDISELTISEERKEPCENTEVSAKKKKKKEEEKEFKKVNTEGKRSLGWGRMRRKGIGKFYTDDGKDACRLLYLLTKYKERNDWNHRHVLHYSHPKINNNDEEQEEKNLVLKYCTRGHDKIANKIKELAGRPGVGEKMSEVIDYIETIEAVKNLYPHKAGDEAKLIEYLKKYGQRLQDKEFTNQLSFEGSSTRDNIQGQKSSVHIVREHIPNRFLNSKNVWELMLLGMPMTAMILNLGKMSSLKMFTDGPDNTNTELVLSALDNEQRLQRARVHPVALLIAAQNYARGCGEKGNLKWPVNKDIVKSLNDAFYKSFKSPELGKTSKKYLLALDVSGSMRQGGCHGCEALTPAMATAAMAMLTWNMEDVVEIMAFSGEFLDLKPLLKKTMLVQEAMKVMEEVNFGDTDCSLPMIFGLLEKKEIDVFIVYTDSEVCYESWRPMEALQLYNREMNRDAKLIVCAMTSAGFTIAHPDSPNALDICGFDAHVPELINQFVSGNDDLKCDVCDNCKKT